MSRSKNIVMTIDGPGFLKGTQPGRMGSLLYVVAGNGFSGVYSRNEILSELAEDETTTDLNFNDSNTDSDSEGADGTSTIQPDEGDDDPMNLEEGTELPWDPEPTEEWDGQLTQLPDGGDISLTPTKSTDDADFGEDPEGSTQVFGKIAGIDWDSEDHGRIGQNHEIFVNKGTHDIHWVIGDNSGNPIHENSHSNPHGIQPEDEDHALNLMGEDAAEVEQGGLSHGRQGFIRPRQAFVEYVALVQSDPMVRMAAWKDVRKKARRMLDSGDVMVTSNTSREILAKVDGDNGRYDTAVHRKNAFGQGVTYWDCDCEWGKHAYKRTRTFIGRMCSHALATYWAMQTRQAPKPTHRKVDNTTERHSLASYTAAMHGLGPKQFQEEYRTPNPNLDNNFRSGYEGEDPKKVSGPKYVRRPQESLASKQGGLMIWDDDLHKVMKQMFPQSTPGGAPGDPGAPGGSPMSADPSQMGAGVPGGLGQDPGLDPSQMGDPNGSGLQPGGATPPFVRATNGPTEAAPVNTPTGAPVTASIWEDSDRKQQIKGLSPDEQKVAPQRPSIAETMGTGGPDKMRSWRTDFDQYMNGRTAEFTNGDTSNDFAKWDEPNSDDAETFNDVQDLGEENNPEEAVYDDFYGRSSSILADFRFGKEENGSNFAPGEHDDDDDDHYDKEIEDDKSHRKETARGWQPHSGEDPAEYGYDSSEDYTPPKPPYARSKPSVSDDPWQDSPELSNMPKKVQGRRHFADDMTPPVDPTMAQNPAQGMPAPVDPAAMPGQVPGQSPAMAAPADRTQGFTSMLNSYFGGALTEDQFTGGDQSPTAAGDALGINPEQNPVATDNIKPAGQMPETSSMPFVPRTQPQGGFQGYSKQHFADDESNNDDSDDSADSWQEDPDVAQNYGEDGEDVSDYHDDDEDYNNDESDNNGMSSTSAKRPRTFGELRNDDDADDAYTSSVNVKEAENFNYEADDVVLSFQRQAGNFMDDDSDSGSFHTMGLDPRTAGRHFTFGEQQELIDESEGKTARQLADLTLANSFYE